MIEQIAAGDAHDTEPERPSNPVSSIAITSGALQRTLTGGWSRVRGRSTGDPRNLASGRRGNLAYMSLMDSRGRL